MDWIPTVQAIRATKLQLAQVDPRGGMPLAPPAGADPRAVAAVERRIGHALPASYRAFLETHDGWPQLLSGATLLGCRPLCRGTYEGIATLVLEEAMASWDLGPAARLVPFGIDARAETVFAFVVSDATPPGEELPVVVWANEVAELVDGFPAFLGLVLELLRADLEDRQKRVHRARFSHGMPRLADLGLLP